MPTKRRRLLIDVDEVLADFQTPFFEAVHRLFGRKLSAEDCQVWDCFSLLGKDEALAVIAEIEKPGWCTALQPRPGAQEAIKHLRGWMDIYAVTSPFPSKTWVHEREAWLRQHFDFTGKDIVHTRSKYVVKGDAFLDDNPDHVAHWQDEHSGAVAMLWHIPNTRLLGHDDIRVRSWEEVITRLEYRLKPVV
jgi:5'(3')-deoxyribonucleotidase